MMKADVRQQQMLKRFFAEETAYFSDNVLSKMVGYILMTIPLFMMVVPFQMWEKDMGIILFYMYMLQMLGVKFFLQPYTSYKENKKWRVLWEVLQYCPVSAEQLCIFRMRKARKVCAWLTGITVVLQTVCAIRMVHTFSLILNVILPLCAQFLFPQLAILISGLKEMDFGQ